MSQKILALEDALAALEATEIKLRISEELRLKAEIETRKSSSRFTDLFLHAPTGIGISSLTGQWIQVNPMFCQLLGYSEQELLSKTVLDITPETDRLLGRNQAEELLAGTRGAIRIEKRYIHKDGSLVWVLLIGSLIRDDLGEPSSFLIQVVDITEKKKSEELLGETTERLQTLIESSPLGIYTVDLENRVTLWNPACEQIYGWKQNEVLGRPLPFISTNMVDSTESKIRAMYSTQSRLDLSDKILRKDSRLIETRVSAMPLIDKKGKAYGYMALAKDVTEQTRALQELKSARRSAEVAAQAKTDFLSNISHEIRTPLNGVIGVANLLLDLELGPTQRQYASTIQNSADILLRLTNDILDFTKLESEKIQLQAVEFDLAKLLEDVSATFEFALQKKSLKFEKQFASTLPKTVRGDAIRLRQVLSRLIGNAIKFTPKGSITLQVEAAPSASAPQQFKFSIRDTGIGLSKESVGKLFEVFTQADSSTTRKFGGTGLGLAISKGLVKLMGGEIGVESQPGEGSTFWFKISLQNAQLLPTSEEFTVPTPLRKLHILVAEDNEINQLIAKQMLSRMGHDAVIVANGQEAIDELDKHDYDVVLMDCQMPVMDGYVATQTIRQTNSKAYGTVSIVAMTANAMPGDREKCLAVGMDDYIAKPVSPKALQKILEHVSAHHKAHA